MSEEQRTRYIITNHQDQPVELYLTTGVVVLEPRGTVEVQEVDIETPQLRVLRDNRLITTDQVVEMVSTPTPETRRRSKLK